MYVPLGSTVAFAASTYPKYVSCILSIYGHAQSQGWRHPAGAKPPFTVCINIYLLQNIFLYNLMSYVSTIYTDDSMSAQAHFAKEAI